jgi:hypothetical protein
VSLRGAIDRAVLRRRAKKAIARIGKMIAALERRKASAEATAVAARREADKARSRLDDEIVRLKQLRQRIEIGRILADGEREFNAHRRPPASIESKAT